MNDTTITGTLYEVIKAEGWHVGTAYDALNGSKGATLSELVDEGHARISENPSKKLESHTIVLVIIPNGSTMWKSNTSTTVVDEVMSDEEIEEHYGTKAVRVTYYEVDDLQEKYGLASN